jgi:hypothetical protein
MTPRKPIDRRAWWYQERRRQQWDRNRARNAGLTVAAFRARPKHQILCCSTWQAITKLPHVCPTCGRRYLERPPAS